MEVQYDQEPFARPRYRVIVTEAGTKNSGAKQNVRPN